MLIVETTPPSRREKFNEYFEEGYDRGRREGE